MDEDDMQMFGVSDLYEYVKGRANFGVWHNLSQDNPKIAKSSEQMGEEQATLDVDAIPT